IPPLAMRRMGTYRDAMTAGSCDVAIMQRSRSEAITRPRLTCFRRPKNMRRMALLVGSAAAIPGVAPAVLSAIRLAATATSGRARAETSADDKALATVLFKEGRAMMARGDISLACPKFEESHRLDPSGGTILNLALCHEQQGLLARSWSELNEA